MEFGIIYPLYRGAKIRAYACIHASQKSDGGQVDGGMGELYDRPDQITLPGEQCVRNSRFWIFRQKWTFRILWGAVLIVPIGVGDPSDRRWNWDRKMTIDSVEICDVLRGTWQVWSKGYPSYGPILPKRKWSRIPRTVGDRAKEFGYELASENKGARIPNQPSR